MESSSKNLDCVTWAHALKARIGELQQQSSQDLKKNRTTGKRQLDAIRTNLSKIVDELQGREKDLLAAQVALQQQSIDFDVQRKSIAAIDEAIQQNIVNICDPVKNLESLAQAIRQDIATELSTGLRNQLARSLETVNSNDKTDDLNRGLNELEKQFADGHAAILKQLPSEVAKLVDRSLDNRAAAEAPVVTQSTLAEAVRQLEKSLKQTRESISEQVPAEIRLLIEEALDKRSSTDSSGVTESCFSAAIEQLEKSLKQTRESITEQVPTEIRLLIEEFFDMQATADLPAVVESRIAEGVKQLETLLNQTGDSIVKQLPASGAADLQLAQVAELMESLRQRQVEVDAQRLESTERMNAAERLFDRTVLQRKSVARSLRLKQRLVRSEAERIKQVSLHREDSSDSERLQALLDKSTEEINHLRSAVADAKSRIDSLSTELASAKKSSSLAQAAAEKSKAEVSVLQSQLADCEALLEESIEGSTTNPRRPARDSELEKKLAASILAQERLESQLAEAHQTLLEERNGEPSHEESVLIGQLKHEVAELQDLLAQARRAGSDDVAQSQLQTELRRAEVELLDLRSQNSDLASQVAKLRVCVRQNHGPQPHLAGENLSWEDRKKLMLQQLEAECDDDTPQSLEKRSEVEAIIEKTEAEINRRDREISELRALLEEQSHARDGIAIGAAAIAELIESDELVQLEREKLRNIQQEWEQKLRQAEIEFSMERARLGRERAQLEERVRSLEASLPAATTKADTEKQEKPSGRRWLDRLGLKDDK